jgi:iron complex outermembrane recepter protein
MKSGFLLAASTVALLYASSPALAQEQSGASAEEPSTGLGEIIVTAQRKAESAQKAAVAIDVIGADELTSAGVNNVTALSKTAPSLAVAQAGGPNVSLFIRGVGNFTFNGFTDPAVAFNVDGVYLGRATSAVGTYYDLERIEVLKGPQGTLYGRNATGGAVNVLPARPRLEELSGHAGVEYGNYNSLDFEAAANVPLGERAALRIAGRLLSGDGTNADGTNDQSGQAIRAQLLLKPSDAFSIRLSRSGAWWQLRWCVRIHSGCTDRPRCTSQRDCAQGLCLSPLRA